MNAVTVVNVPPWVVLVLAAIGLYALGFGLCRMAKAAFRAAVRRWVWPWMHRRHEAVCVPLNKQWKGKLVRHVSTGRVGLCVAVGTRERPGWWRQLRPQWTADVLIHPKLALHYTEAVRVYGPAMVMFGGLSPEVMMRIPVGEMTLAPAGDAETFREAMKGAES